MKTFLPIRLVVAWMLLLTLSHAQVSTFPKPPALAPPPDNSPASATSVGNPSSVPPPPDTADSTQPGGTKSGTPSTPGATTNTAPTVPISAATLSSMSALNDKDDLAAGDSISFRVIEDRDKAIPLVVTDTGEVDFPLIGRVKVEGKTCHAVAIEVKRLLEVDYYKQATVIVGLDLIAGQDKTKAHDMAWVVGEVRQVGPQELIKAQPMTVSQVILRAGGFGEFADQRKVKVIHRSGSASGKGNEMPDISNVKDAQIVDVKSVFDGKSSSDPMVRDGDYIVVPKKLLNFGN